MRSVAEAFPAWSKSGLQALTTGCSWQVFLSKVMQLDDPGSPATLAGTAYHAALELHERARIVRLRGGDVRVPDIYDLKHKAADVVWSGAEDIPPKLWDLHGTTADEVVDGAHNAIDHWWDTPYDDWGESLRDRLMRFRPVLAEPYFKVPLDGSSRPLHGYIDWVGYDHQDACWVIVDHKSARTFGRWPRDGAGHEVEAAAYTVGALQAAGLPVAGQVRMEWHVARTVEPRNDRFEGARLVTRTVDKFDRQLLVDAASYADLVVDEGRFEKNVKWNLCAERWCAFWEGCERTGELAPESLLPTVR